jgi:hypothetical protein
MLPLQSESIDQVTAAFVAARKTSKPFREDSKANYGSYVSIDEIKACTNESLLANGLSLTQTRTVVDGQILLVTKLMHVSGQWQASYVPLIIPETNKNLDQAYGSSMTYQRRYELYGLFAFKGEELDPDADKSYQPASNQVRDNSSQSQGVISEKQLGLLKTLLNGNKDREAKLCAHYKIDSLAQLPWRYMDEVVKILKGQ